MPHKIFDLKIKPSSPLGRGLLLIPLVVACFALSPRTQAVVPPPDGGYPGFNTAEGDNALFNLVIGSGFWNTALGGFTLFETTTGDGNTAVGLNALRNNTTGTFNNALGVNSLLFNTVGVHNVAIGYRALSFNGDGNRNTAVGYQASFVNTTADDVTAVGWNALRSNTGIRNCAFGSGALQNNTTGSNASNAFGYQALFSNTTGLFNNAFGWRALNNNVSGSNNTAIGDGAGFSVTGSNNTCLGANAGTGFTTASNSVAIGLAGSNQSGRTWIRNANVIQSFSAGVNNYVTVEVATGRIGMTAVVSSQRYKHDIRPMDNSSEAIFRLKPVTFRLKQEFDENQLPQWGLIAEDVEKVDPNLISRNYKGEIEAVRYEAVNAMLLNEFLKEHKRVEQQQASIAELRSTVAQQQKEMEVLTAQLREQASQIQKVSAQVELNKRAPQTVVNK
jgi:uncharacterized coiled-coil protein SlyX